MAPQGEDCLLADPCTGQEWFHSSDPTMVNQWPRHECYYGSQRYCGWRLRATIPGGQIQEVKVTRWQPQLVVKLYPCYVPPGKTVPAVMTRTPNPAEARGTGTESTKSPTGTWSAILSRTISVTTSWFPASFFLLGINNHVEVSHVVHVTHPCRQFPLSWSFTCAFWRPFQHSKG